MATWCPESPVAVTGAQGLLGRHLVAELLASATPAVVGIGRSPGQCRTYTHTVSWQGHQVPAPLPPQLRAAIEDHRYRYQALDVRDAASLTALLRDCDVRTVIHAAATLRDSPWPELLDSNLGGTIGVATAAADVGADLLLVSSGSVYGDGLDLLPFTEDGAVRPLDPYAVTKRASEDIARVIGASAGIRVLIARVFNLLGPGLQERHLPAVLAQQVVTASETGQRLRLRLGRLTSTRDFIDVRDAASGLVQLVGTAAPFEVVNVASGMEVPVRQVLDCLVRLAGIGQWELASVGGRNADVERSVADVNRLRKHGVTTRYPLTDTLQSMLDYYRFVARQRPEGEGGAQCG